ncbi:acetolactate synthase [Kordiimonas sediminis]|uniref:Acetolactate synthase n=1 Tax=Kordiimonas sediminis TaxID=1735581 RepID=A0A919AR45_9PROT|nr:thiamine pyrophosphate-binding protein [Kordiimonas sediminis]GHF20744.1 acetolactate synthase [Kordiimonas sediminis]
MKKSGAWLVRHALEQLGVRYTFGIPGVHTTEMYDELNKSNQIKPVLVSHEAGGAFMADAISRTSDSIGVLVVVPAAGLTHAMSGIGEAYLDGIPMLVLSGSTRTDTEAKFQLHEMDQQALMAPLTKATFKVETHEDIVPTLYKAYDIATTGEPGPVYVEVPVNLQLYKGDAGTVLDYTPPERLGKKPDPADIEAAAQLLAAANKPGIFLGWGNKRAMDAAIRIAEKLNAPVSTSLQGLGVFKADHPLHTGMSFGKASVPASEAAFTGIDAMLAVGVRFGEIASGSFDLQVPENLVHLDINPDTIGANYPAKVGIEADAAEALPMLADALDRIMDAPRAASPAALIAEKKAAYKAEWAAHDSGDKVNPGLFFASLDAHLSETAIVATDDGNHTFLTAELMPIRAGRDFISPTDFNCMGYCLPAVNAAKLANRDREVIGIIGDGAFTMTAMEALTARAEGLGVVYFIFADGELSQIAQGQEIPYNRKTCTVLPPLKHEAFADAVGAAFVGINTNNDLDTGIKQALDIASTDRPVIVAVNIDYSKRTRFTEGVVKSNLNRFDLGTKLRFVGRALKRKITG